MYIYIYIYIHTSDDLATAARGNHLSNTTCLTQMFFRR